MVCTREPVCPEAESEGGGMIGDGLVVVHI